MTVDGLIDPDAFNMGIDELFQICDSTGANPSRCQFFICEIRACDDRVAMQQGMQRIGCVM